MSSRKYSKAQVNVLKKRETEYWIYSYSDLVTNLLALFIMMLIIKSGGKQKQDDLQRGLEAYASGQKLQDASKLPGMENVATLEQLKQVVTKYLQDNQLDKRVSLFQSKSGISFSFEGGLLFDLGTANLQPEAQVVMANIAGLIKKIPSHFNIEVEGHADNKPITSGTFPSNWELSSARAGSVVRFLSEQGIVPGRMRAIGYADTKPLDETGDSPLNRRVIVRIETSDEVKK